MLNHRELGKVIVDAGDVVVFSMDEILRLAEALNISEDTLIARYKGIPCELGSDGVYGVDQMVAVTKEGNTHPVVVIGCDPQNFLRFLDINEQDFGFFYKSHPLFPTVGKGKNFNIEVFETIAQDYRTKLLENKNEREVAITDGIIHEH